ncbi:MAG: DUF4388 domain-containing protein [Candidatus Coatesbacteria bacterium]|nr:DUF4388 domain-containing protein [Candidatus Coatesbacteria bacterium]
MLKGSLSRIALGSVFQHIIDQGLSGRLSIATAEENLQFFFDRGRLQNAAEDPESDGSRGIFDRVKGEFHFDSSQEVDTSTKPELSTFRWVMNRAHETTNARAMQWVLLSPYAIPQNVAVPIAELNDFEMQISALIDDERTIAEILKVSEAEEIKTLRVLFGLTIANTVRLVRTFEVVRILSGIIDDFVIALGETRMTINGAERMFGKVLSEMIVVHPQLEYLELGGSEQSLGRLRTQFNRAAVAMKVLGDLLERYYKAIIVFLDSKQVEGILRNIVKQYFGKHRSLVSELRLDDLIDHIISESSDHERRQLWADIDMAENRSSLIRWS